jgi:hypothetical protein
METHASFKERNLALSDRFDAIRDRWAMERHDLMAVAWWSHEDDGTEAKHPGDHGTDVDPASPRNGCGRDSFAA